MADAQLYEDTFTITAINSGKYDRVSRISCTSLDNLTNLTLDVNTELYPCSVNETVSIVLASTLALDGTKDDAKGWRDVGRGTGMGAQSTLADNYDYVCYGKIYRFEDNAGGENIKVFVSFGGLLLFIDGPYKKLTPLRIDHVYLLMKK